MTTVVILASLILLACISPLLTFLTLWQVKEWRFDRLRDHLRSHGSLSQLLGRSRPLIVFGGVGLFLTLMLAEIGTHEMGIGIIALTALASIGIGLVQWIKQSHRIPVWTSKAVVTFSLSMVLNAILIGWITAAMMFFLGWYAPVFALPVILLQSTVAMAAGLMLKPLDWFLKQRILRKATRMRNAQPNLTVIGITGSVGKTTTKELLAHILQSKGALSTPLHVNSEIGVAGWLIGVLGKEPTDSERVLIVEMGAYRKGEIALLCRIAKPTLGVITAIGTQHLGLFGSREKIIQAKGELFEALPEHGHAFGNADNDAFGNVKTKCRCPVTSVGTERGADVRALDIEETSTGIRFSVGDTVCTVPLFGTHTVTSVLLAIAVAKHLGMTLPEIAKELRSFQSLERTFELKTVNGVTVLDDTYNLSPESFRAAIAWAANQPHARKILVTEGIIELGNEEAAVHEHVAEQAASVFDEAYVAHERLLPYFHKHFGDRAKHVSYAPKLQAGDLLVCSGRVHESIPKKFLPA